MRWVPAARSSKWLIYAGVSALFISVMLWVVRFGVLGQTFTGVHAFRFMLMAIVLSLLINVAGWLGARKLWVCANIGVLLGLIMMATYTDDKNGWWDLISLLVFLQLTVAGFIAGVVVEIVYYIIRRVRQN